MTTTIASTLGRLSNPPPAEEHAGLRRWVRENMHKNPVRLDSSLRARLLDEIVRLFVEKQVELLVVAGAVDHVHGVGLFPANEVRQLIGHAKRYSSHAIRNQIPGSVWGRKCGLKRITDKEQQRRTFNYIADHRDEGASVWTFRDAR